MPIPFVIYDNGIPCRILSLKEDSKEKTSNIFSDLGKGFSALLEKATIHFGCIESVRFKLISLQIEVRETVNFGIKFLTCNDGIFAGCQEGTVRISENKTWTELVSGYFYYRSATGAPSWELHLNKGLCRLLLVCGTQKITPTNDYCRSHFSPKISIVIQKLPNHLLEDTRKSQLDNWLSILENEVLNITHRLSNGKQVIPNVPDYFVEAAYRVGNKIINSFDSLETLGQIVENKDLSGIHFSIAFKELFGCSPKQLQKRVRMQKAKQLLKEGVSHHEVAKVLGYRNWRDFKNVFNAYYGVSI